MALDLLPLLVFLGLADVLLGRGLLSPADSLFLLFFFFLESSGCRSEVRGQRGTQGEFREPGSVHFIGTSLLFF